MARTGYRERTTKETTIVVEIDWMARPWAGSRPRPAFRSSTTCSISWGATGVRPPGVLNGDLAIDAHHTVEDVGSLWVRHSTRRWGTRPGCGGSPLFGYPFDEALVDVALDLSGRPYLHYEVEFPGEKILGDPPFDPS
ncbi:MAG: hypothetical protein Ct9H300mP12_04930 [Acidimicrobiales bacterium]|nr:MAG: hypothetical protein Ct9H300mP12_04930 [Acidimicrobiales bacterium]